MLPIRFVPPVDTTARGSCSVRVDTWSSTFGGCYNHLKWEVIVQTLLPLLRALAMVSRYGEKTGEGRP
eukprot:5023135-Prorocentrum_lima.AAC.1